MQSIGLWLMPIEIEGPGREILEGYGSPASMPQQGFTVFLIAV
jgi:hypothetical protein